MDNLNRNFVSNYKEPHFNFEDLKLDDIKEDNYKDPYYALRPIEPERLQSIYQQAFIYDLLYNFAKEFLPDVEKSEKYKDKDDKTNKVNKNKTTDTTIDSIKDKVIEYLFKNHPRIDENEIVLNPNKGKFEESGHVNANSIWGTNDLNVLRKTFAGIKDNNYLLKSRLTVIQSEYDELKDKYEKLKFESQPMSNDVKSLEKENQRLYIRIQDLESRYEIYCKELESAEKSLRANDEEKYELKKSIQQLTSDKIKFEYENNKHIQKLASVKSELKLYYMAKIDGLKLKYTKEIEFLKKRFFELNEKYKNRKSQLEKSQKALDHLRSHFAVTYNSGEKNVDKISENQIKIF